MVCEKHWKWQSALKGSQNSYFCFLSFCFQIHNQCLYTYTVRTFIIMSEMKICIIFPSNGLYIIPLPLSASVQAHANFVQPKRIQIIHCTPETQIQLHSVSKLDIALVFFPGLSTPALCSLCSPAACLRFFFFLTSDIYLAPAEQPRWRKTGITRLLIFGDFTQKMLLQGPSLPPAAWSHAPLNNQQHAHNQQHVDAPWPLWSVLAEASKRNPVRGCNGIRRRPHAPARAQADQLHDGRGGWGGVTTDCLCKLWCHAICERRAFRAALCLRGNHSAARFFPFYSF